MTAAAAYSFTEPRHQPRHPTVRPAPRREPPFDDERPAGAAPRLRVAGQVDRELPFPTVQAPARDAACGEAPLPGYLPDPTRWGARLVIGIGEVAAGRRPLAQLGSLLSWAVIRGLGADFEKAAIARRRHWTHAAAVRTARSCRPAAGVAEVAITVACGHRVRAVAMRLEERHGRWQCVRLQLG